MNKNITNEEFFGLFEGNKPVFFIQIGANNGISWDPINHLLNQKKDWTGLLFEPGEQAFQELQKTYEGFDKLVLINSAVSDIDGKTTLYCGETTPHFTLDKTKAIHMFNIVPNEIEVDVISPKTIIEKYGVNNLDLLQIDTEGRDFTIIKSFINSNLLPKIIRFEYVNLAYDNVTETEVIDFLSGHGYESYYVTNEGDIVSILKK